MPRSPIRRRSAYTPAAPRPVARVGSPPWLAPLMCACFVLGLLWIVVYYISQTEYPIGSLGVGNMGVGFGLILVGFALATRWR